MVTTSLQLPINLFDLRQSAACCFTTLISSQGNNRKDYFPESLTDWAKAAGMTSCWRISHQDILGFLVFQNTDGVSSLELWRKCLFQSFSGDSISEKEASILISAYEDPLNPNKYQLTIRAFLFLWRASRTGKEHFGGGTPIGQIYIQPGKGDGILDDGGNSRRWRRQILGCFSWTVVRAPPDLTERPGEERSNLVVGGGERICFPVVPVGRATMVTEKGGVPEHITSSAHVHRVAEVAQRRADHVQGEVTFKSPLAVGLGDQTF